MGSSCFETEQLPALETLSVEVVISAPRIHPWILKLPMSQLVCSLNTTHWGLKVGSSYYDLKLRGLYRTKPDVAFAATLAERDERAVAETISVGKTHLTIEEVRNFGRSKA